MLATDQSSTLEDGKVLDIQSDPSSNPRRYRSIWISDVHMGSRDCQAKALLNFLNVSKSKYLYIVGDFIDLWQLRRRWFWAEEYNSVIQKTLCSARSGTEVVFVPGNHDEGFRQFFGYQFGEITIHSRVVHVTANGKRLLVFHGDEFDTAVQSHRWLAFLGSAAYDYLVIANRILNSLRKCLGLPYWSFSGYVKRRVKNAVKFITSYEEIVTNYARKLQADGVVCGHIHQPTIKHLDDIVYANTGDWVENCTALVEHWDGRLELIYWHESGAPVSAPFSSFKTNAMTENFIPSQPTFSELLGAVSCTNPFAYSSFRSEQETAISGQPKQ